ncbi:MAG: tRNA epoxyqueuosine(34) reductase QueG [Bdellovibrionaceae bacterium]|nr:tRNA epoxyqueuosine(34) reductase QueG [Pseudobdellovibrionaceae bacterium]
MSQDLVKHILHQHSISHYGFAPLTRPLSLDVYKNWLAEGHHADMDYLAAHLAKKETPQLLSPTGKSAIVFTTPYPKLKEDFPLQHLKVAKYAQGHDYHYWLKEKVEAVCKDLKKLVPNEEFVGFTESSPVLERDLAFQAGLGWFGKNSCIISRNEGSYFLIAEIYSSIALHADGPVSPDHCGTCNRCVEACPTEAILDNRTLDANKCISYWTIEAKTTPPIALAKNFSSLFFGCDICQDVCPWNQKVYGKQAPEKQDRAALVRELRWVLTSSNNELERTFKQTPLLRARGRGLKRNALVVIANNQLEELKTEVKDYLEHKDLGKIAQWTYSTIHN